jgi:hypothetical protein
MTFFDDIPDNPELAFLQLEKLFREDCAKAIVASSDSRSSKTGERSVSSTAKVFSSNFNVALRQVGQGYVGTSLRENVLGHIDLSTVIGEFPYARRMG